MEKDQITQIDKTLQKCAVCQGEIFGKAIKKMGNFYCSIYCAEVNRERMENLDMEKLDFNELGAVIGKFMNTCQKCVLPLKCRSVRCYCASYFDELHEYISMRWCCHAIFGLSCMLSDGSVDISTVKKLIVKTEDCAREKGYKGINPSVLAQAEGELIEDFSYDPGPDNIPPVPKEEHEHYLACVNCDKSFMDECLKLTEAAEALLPEVEAMIDFPYCGHTKYEIAAMMLNPKVDKENLKKLIKKSKKIADEKKFKGGQYRIHYLSVGRSISNN
jgi:hypothetical protein